MLAQALDRLVSTTIKTNIRAENRREATFSWLDGWTQLVDEKTERSRGMTLELSNWFWEGVMMQGGVLSIDRAYFDISGGRERWLYRVARKHAGGAGEGGFAISMPVLFEKSGAEGQCRRFKFEMLKLSEKNALPGYALAVETAQRDDEPMLRMTRVDGKDGAEESLPKVVQAVRPAQEGEGSDVISAPVSPGKRNSSKSETAPADDQAEVSKLLCSAVVGLSDKARRGFMTDETIEHLHEKCPGWDLYALHTDFERWVDADAARLPANWQKAFIGWVKRHHEKHKHELRG